MPAPNSHAVTGKPVRSEQDDTFDLDFTSPAALTRLQAEAASRARSEGEARARAVEAARDATAAHARAQDEARARAAAEARAVQEAQARVQADAAVRKAECERTRAEAQVHAAETAQKKAEAALRAQLAAADEVRASLEAQTRAQAEKQARAAAAAIATAEARAREEAEARSRAESEARARVHAEAHARALVEAQLKAMAAALVRAQALAREEAEARTRLSMDLKAHEDALAQARAEAAAAAHAAAKSEMRTQLQALDEQARAAYAEAAERAESERHAREAAEAIAAREREARAAAEAQVEAERRVREAAVRDAAAKAEARARAETLAALTAERQQQAAAKAAAQAHAAAERRARQAAEAHAEEQTQARIAHEAEIEQRAEAEIRERVAAELQARERAELEADAQYRAEAARRAQAARTLREPERVIRLRRRPVAPAAAKLAGASALALLILAALFVHVVPWSSAPVERLLQRDLHQRVSVGRVQYEIFPAPRLVLEQVAIGSQQQLRVERISAPVWPWEFLGAPARVADADASGVEINAGGAALLGSLLDLPHVVPTGLRRLTVQGIALRMQHLDLVLVEGLLRFSSGGRLEHARLATANSTLDVTPGGAATRLKFAAHDWSPPLAPALRFDALGVEATVQDDTLKATHLEGRLAGGTLLGTLDASWRDAVRAKGRFELVHADLRTLLSAFTSRFHASGTVTLRGSYEVASPALAHRAQYVRASVDFNVAAGALDNVDLVRALSSAGMGEVSGGRTRFDVLSGVFEASSNHCRFRRLKLASGPFSASGEVDLSARDTLGGRVATQIAVPGRPALRSVASIGGTPAQPVLRPN